MNIVTIDFDIIMEPSIGFYNNLVGPEKPLKDYVEDFSFITNLPANLFIYEYMTNYITKVALDMKADIYFINQHQDIIPIVEKYKSDDPIELFNIDHHHDVGYEVSNWRIPVSEPTCGNWVKVLKDSKLIDKYYWIKNENSDDIPKKGAFYIDNVFEIKNEPLELLSKNTDALIICSSYEWIPPIYHPLFVSWNEICSEIRGENFSLDCANEIDSK